MNKRIKYKEGYKYQLSEDAFFDTGIFPPSFDIKHGFFILSAQGILQIKYGYAWDGASGPTIDTKSSMRAALVHDCFCQMLRNRDLPYEVYAEEVHSLFRRMLLEDGMFAWRAWYWHKAVVLSRGGHPDNEDCNPEVEAP